MPPRRAYPPAMLHDPGPTDPLTGPRLRTLVELTDIPTAAGREQGVVDWVLAWVAERPHLAISADAAGNLVISAAAPRAPARRPLKPGARRRAAALPPLFITAHLDHPAFVVEAIDQKSGTLALSFRGGVEDVYFDHAPITLHSGGLRVPAAIIARAHAKPGGSPLDARFTAELDAGRSALASVRVGDIATWTMPGSAIDAHGVLHAPACDDLAAAAAALCAIDELHAQGVDQDVRVLLTRAEEVGFIGAIAACRLGTMPKGSRILALENSRAFADSPVGGGPVVRVGDRLSIFTPWLTGACALRARETFDLSPTPVPGAVPPVSASAKRPWQRKLMSGGACEASVFCHWGYDATCLCLPLGNYHNMAHLDRVQAGTYDATELGPPRCEREFIHTRDYLGLVDLLVALGRRMPDMDQCRLPIDLDHLYAQRSSVLGAAARDPRPRTSAPRARKKSPKPRAVGARAKRRASTAAPRAQRPKPRAARARGARRVR